MLWDTAGKLQKYLKKNHLLNLKKKLQVRKNLMQLPKHITEEHKPVY